MGTAPEARPYIGRTEFGFRIDADRAENVAGDGIEKRAIEIAVGATRDDDLVGPLDIDPQRHVGAFRLQPAGDGRNAPCDPLFIQLDARNRIELSRMPVFGEKIQRRTPRDPAELFVVQTKVFGDHRGVILRGDAVSSRCGVDGDAHERVPPYANARLEAGAPCVVNCSVSVLPAIAPVECAPALIAVWTASK